MKIKDRKLRTESLFWLIEESLLKGACLDLPSECAPGLTTRLCESGMVKRRHITEAVGPDLSNVTAVAAALGQRSTRQAEAFLGLWKKRLMDRS